MSRTVALEASPSGLLPPIPAYDLAAICYDAWTWQAFWRRHEFPVVREAIERQRRARQRGVAILDVGCGTGWYLEQLRSLCGAIVGIDASQGMLAVARHRLPDATLLQQDARVLPFHAKRFDVVLCTRVLSHLPQVRPALTEMARVLSPGGLLILSDVDAEHEYEHTRLPIPAGHVFARTFKHAREPLFAMVDADGFFRDAAYLIHADGAVRGSRGRRPRPGSSVAGWVAAWRRDSSAPKFDGIP